MSDTVAVADPRPLVVHVLYRFDVGGLENGVVNLINRMPADAYRHAVLALTEVSEFRRRIERADVRCIALDKPPGHLFGLYPRLYRLFRELRPAIVHSRNLAALEVAVPAWAAGVPVRIHGEHGRDIGDLDGSNRTYRWLRRAYGPFVHRFVALSRDLESYLRDRVGIAPDKIVQCYNGVDIDRFHPAAGDGREAAEVAEVADWPFRRGEHWVLGTVGRMQPVKNQPLLARAFVLALETAPALRRRLRLALIGDGPLRHRCREILAAAGVEDLAWLPGERDDIPQLLRRFDCFVLPSLAEGISNTILEAMASGLPVIATAVGGNGELIDAGITGTLTANDDAAALAEAIVAYAAAPELAGRAGLAGRQRVVRQFSLPAMVENYRRLYDRLLFGPARPAEPPEPPEPTMADD